MRILTIILLLPALILFGLANKKQEKLRLVFISGSNEYVSNVSLQQYKNKLENNYPQVSVTILQAGGPLNAKEEFSSLDGTEALASCDVLLVFARRTTITGKAIEHIRKYVQSGKPLVALRTSSHGLESWPEFDKEVLGGNYSGHFRGEPEKRVKGADGLFIPVGEPKGPLMSVIANQANSSHPVLAGITEFQSRYSLYKVSPITADAKLLLTGKTAEGEEPVAWTRNHLGGRVVYIGLGGLLDWETPAFVQLVTNALFWAADFKVKK